MKYCDDNLQFRRLLTNTIPIGVEEYCLETVDASLKQKPKPPQLDSHTFNVKLGNSHRHPCSCEEDDCQSTNNRHFDVT